MILVGQITLAVLAILVLAGGIAGNLKAQSKLSLVYGVISCILLSIAYALSLSVAKIGIMFGDVIALLLTILFLWRYGKTRKFMPGGLMFVLCMVAVVILSMSVFGG